ncbi:hypothetical protein FNV43_RR06621 [Rhamnella rubrinervis]|uniref:Uncharacterized protein n=1 Tax=Rhamnella rubrinervis TaxID=2594499 RepID=A0A8K0HDR5_9ROSA|nr:hypothetical protein FNV43_RR06621 [Rhamnella rubrinervis]
MAASNLHCVAIAYRSYELDKVPTDEEQPDHWALPEDDLILHAIVGIKDPCRPGVRDEVRLCQKAGVKFGKEIDSHDAIIRDNEAPVNEVAFLEIFTAIINIRLLYCKLNTQLG